MVIALVILVLFVLVIIELIRIRIRMHARAAMPAWEPPGVRAVEIPTAPDGVFLDRGHAWLRLAENGVATVGVDSFLCGVVGRIDGLELPPEGSYVERGDELLAIRQGDRRACVRSPVSGVVVSANPQWLVEKETLSQDPYGDGWLCRIRPKNISAAIPKLRIAEDARSWLAAEVRRLRDFLLSHGAATALGTVCPDGGALARGVLQIVSRETWETFVKEFLRPGASD